MIKIYFKLILGQILTGGLLICRLFSNENKPVTKKLINYSIAMVAFPVATFYFFFLIVFKGNILMVEWAGLAAVFAVNIVIFLYVRMAYTEDVSDDVNGKAKNKEILGGKSQMKVD